jgi:hypothetical protein
MDMLIVFAFGALMGFVAGLIMACIILVLHNDKDIL